MDRQDYRDARILDRLTEPDRALSFRVTWLDDQGEVQVNRGWRVQFNHLLGPYKGGLRFHPSVSESILKFLGFEQTLKNSLTGLPMGGAKGGSDFDPKGRSDAEIMRFCQSLMTELYRYVGMDTDVPAGDIGVGDREIGYLFGQFTRLTNSFEGVLTGKGQSFGGSAVREEATGYGAVYFLRNMLEEKDLDLEGLRIAISGAGNVALFAADKAVAEGARVISVSDSDGALACADGLSCDQITEIQDHKLRKRGRLADLDLKGTRYIKGAKPWGLDCDIAMPCATQNELDDEAVKALVKSGVMAVVEGANMPTTADAIEILRDANVMFAPGKAANAGGVAVSAFERSQNVTGISWSREEVDSQLQKTMSDIHKTCVDHAGHGRQSGSHIDYLDGANIGGFMKVADAMLAHGLT
jgi:glutamate dehydrogenase (NADP+)